MIDFTPLARKSLERRAASVLKSAASLEHTQRAQLSWLLGRGTRAAYCAEHGVNGIKTYEQYIQVVPVSDYEHFRPYVMRMINGERNVLWPGKVLRYAQSSGTSGGKSKFIPITPDSLKLNHYSGASTVMGLYLASNHKSRVFSGKALILGGSYATEQQAPRKVKIGDLSAHLIECVTPAINFFRTPSKHIALMPDWHEKLPALVHAALRSNVTNISGVPSWMLVLLKEMLAESKASNIGEIWPNIEVFFHGGIAFEPYCQEYREIMPANMHYFETYNASEGFFASQISPDDVGMLLIPDIAIFYELIPLDQVGMPYPKSVPLWQAELGATYSLVITASNGLWRYAIGDTVKIVGLDPLRIIVAGRTKSYINAFGEELMVHNADAAITKACQAMNCGIINYTAAPVYTHNGNKGHHQWLIEWSTPPADTAAFATLLDQLLQQENSDYQAKRTGSIFLAPLTLVTAKTGLFDQWLDSTGKLGGQRKVPRLSNNRDLMDQLLALNR